MAGGAADRLALGGLPTGWPPSSPRAVDQPAQPRHYSNRVAPFSPGLPLVGLSAGVLVLGETITPWQWAGIALVVAALACVMLGPELARPAAGRAS